MKENTSRISLEDEWHVDLKKEKILINKHPQRVRNTYIQESTNKHNVYKTKVCYRTEMRELSYKSTYLHELKVLQVLNSHIKNTEKNHRTNSLETERF